MEREGGAVQLGPTGWELLDRIERLELAVATLLARENARVLDDAVEAEGHVARRLVLDAVKKRVTTTGEI